MDRRLALKSASATAVSLLTGGFVAPARAIAPPILVALAGVAISVAIRRYIVGPILSALARLFPRLFASELRKYLLAVAVAFGFHNAKAAVVAERAENSGARDLARDGLERVADLDITNSNLAPLELSELHLLLVDVQSQTIELQSSTSWNLIVAPNATMRRQIAASRFPTPGLKQWYLSDAHRTLAVSHPFMVVA